MAETILNRIEEIARKEGITITALERQLGASKGVLSRAAAKGTDISCRWIQKIVENYPLYNPVWLLSGEGEMMFTEEDAPIKGKIPLYDVATIGGTNEIIALQNGVSHVAEWIDAGDWFPEATSAIHHYGTSMIEYPNGCILALKRVNDQSLIINGRNYVIETDEYRITKQIRDEGDCVMAYSTNRDTYPDGSLIHAPMRIPKAAIRHMDLVLGCVTKEYSNGAIPICKTR